mgnify:CR=1 FL=1
MDEKLKISQSILKDYAAYIQNSLCGKVFIEKHIDGNSPPPSDAMELGNWFEYKCTNQLPRDGHTPEAKTLKNGNLSIDYKRMSSQVEEFKNMMSIHGFKILHTGYQFNKHKFGTGIADIIAFDSKGKHCIIDVKTTGLFNDKWSDFGWDLETLTNKDGLLIQAVQYLLLAEKEFDKDFDFYFAVFSTKKEKDVKLIKVNVDLDRMHQHEIYLANTYKVINDDIKNKRFKAIPDYTKCSSCYLEESCSDKAKTVKINEIWY